MPSDKRPHRQGKRNPPRDDLDRLMDEVAAELGDWFEAPPDPGEVIDIAARKAAKRAKATPTGVGMIGAETSQEGDKHGRS